MLRLIKELIKIFFMQLKIADAADSIACKNKRLIGKKSQAAEFIGGPRSSK
jgi:hypothetical protein